jgi:hypothetical protein
MANFITLVAFEKNLKRLKGGCLRESSECIFCFPSFLEGLFFTFYIE